jgi:chromosome segregation ATPase
MKAAIIGGILGGFFTTLAIFVSRYFTKADARSSTLTQFEVSLLDQSKALWERQDAELKELAAEVDALKAEMAKRETEREGERADYRRLLFDHEQLKRDHDALNREREKERRLWAIEKKDLEDRMTALTQEIEEMRKKIQ